MKKHESNHKLLEKLVSDHNSTYSMLKGTHNHRHQFFDFTLCPRQPNIGIALKYNLIKKQCLSNELINSSRSLNIKKKIAKKKGLTQDTRATVAKVMDNRSMEMLEKLFKWNTFTEINGCISSGKEAMVFFALLKKIDESSDLLEFPRAIKMFKTSVLQFKNRHKYIEGDFRFQTAYSRSSNPRKMVKTWAEKEFRNLKRISSNGIRSPIPIELRGHMFIMTYLGSYQGESTLLKNLCSIRNIPKYSKLIHGDFSEFNLVFVKGHVYVIDVSQAVEIDHPRAPFFLKKDCVNVYLFFLKMLSYDKYVECKDDFEEYESEIDDDEEVEEEDQNDVELKHKEYVVDSKYFDTKQYKCDMLLNRECNILSLNDMFNYIRSEYVDTDLDHLSDKSIQNLWPEFDTEFIQENIKNGSICRTDPCIPLDLIESTLIDFKANCYALAKYLTQCHDNGTQNTTVSMFLNTLNPFSFNQISADELDERFDNLNTSKADQIRPTFTLDKESKNKKDSMYMSSSGKLKKKQKKKKNKLASKVAEIKNEKLKVESTSAVESSPDYTEANITNELHAHGEKNILIDNKNVDNDSEYKPLSNDSIDNLCENKKTENVCEMSKFDKEDYSEFDNVNYIEDQLVKGRIPEGMNKKEWKKKVKKWNRFKRSFINNNY